MMETRGCWARPMPWAGGTGRVAVSTLFMGIKVESMDYFLNKQECTCVFYSHLNAHGDIWPKSVPF